MNSNTASNLMGLLSQWQSIETSLTNYMIETVMKLSSLTESNVFILVETTEGRRFAGKNHLVSLYNNGCLRNDGADVELEADVHSSTLRPKPMPTNSVTSPNACYPPFPTPMVSPARNRKRPNSSTEEIISPSKRLSTLTVDANDIVISDDEDADSCPVKSESVHGETNRYSAEMVLANNLVNDDEEMESCIVKSEPAYVNTNQSSMKLPSVTSHSITSVSQTFDCNEFSNRHRINDPVGINPAVDSDFDLSWVMNEFIAGSKKAHVILGASKGEDFTDVTKKILDSLLYDS